MFDENGDMTDGQRAFLYRLFGFFGGSLGLDTMIAGIGGIAMPQRPDDVANWFDSTMLQLVRTRAAAAARLFDVNRQSAIRLIRLSLS
jgi:hypothetical protein